MKDIILSGFADEAAVDFRGQMDALKRNGFVSMEIRNVDGKSITAFSVQEAKELANQLADNGLCVKSVGSPIGKIEISDDFEAHMELYRHTLELANIFGADKIRLFSFFMPQNENPDNYRNLVLDRMGLIAETAGKFGVTACHENEKGIYGDTASRVKVLLEALPALGSVFDPANFIQCGETILPAWALLKDRTDYLHIKDASADGTVVPSGYGIGQIGAVVKDYLSRGGEVLTLEPHLMEFTGLKGLEEEEGRTPLGSLRFRYRDNNEAFDAAVHALKAILARI